MAQANPNDSELHGGLAGVRFENDDCSLGHGITLRRTYARLMSSFVLAFRKPEPPKHFGEPWKAAKGGMSVDIVAEIHVPCSYDPPDPYDRINTIWWLVSLLRLRSTSLVFSPATASASFSEVVEVPGDTLHIWPIETGPRKIWEETPNEVVTQHDVDWLATHWETARALRKQSSEFAVATLAFDQCIFVSQPELALLSLWGALEALFSPAPHELRFRVSCNIAAFLEPAGVARMELQSRVAKLYDARSKAAHGRQSNVAAQLTDTYQLVRRVLVQIIEEGQVPTHDELRTRLFGATRGG